VISHRDTPAQYANKIAEVKNGVCYIQTKPYSNGVANVARA